jgi:DNA-binding beta-propeller fold protein YncE
VFSNPYDVETHYSTRNIFVADTGQNLVRKFKPSNLAYPFWECSQWGGFGSDKGKFNQPVAIAIDQFSGDVYVSDKGNNRIQKFSFNGEFILERTNMWSTGMEVDKEKNVYVSVAQSNKVYKFTPDLESIPEWDPEGTSAIKFRYPHGITVDRKNDVYVVDTGNFEVKKFSKDGVHLLSWGGMGIADGKFRVAYGITYDVNVERIYVSDSSLHRIQSFTENGIFSLERVL